MKRIILIATLIALCWAVPATAEVPRVGDTLPAFTMAPLPVEEDAAALGLDTNRAFTLADIRTPYVMVEILGVYCAICHEQAPHLARLYKRLRKTKLDQKVTMLGIAAGGTPMEVKYIRKKDYLFPVAADTKFEIYGQLAEPKTPFTMIVDRQGTVVYAHRGLIPDMNELFKTIQALP